MKKMLVIALLGLAIFQSPICEEANSDIEALQEGFHGVINTVHFFQNQYHTLNVVLNQANN